MSRRGRRYDEPKLNFKKVVAVIVAILVVVMIVFIIRNLLQETKDTGKISSSSYYALYADNKWGVINNVGAEIITPAYKEMIIIPNSKKDVFLCTYDIDELDGNYKTKVLNSKNQEVFTDYEKVEALENFDSKNNVWYEDNVLMVMKNGKYGLINLSGEEVLPCEYDTISTLEGVKNSILVNKNGLYGMVNNEGGIVLDTKYKKIINMDEDYKNGYITVDDSNQYGVVDYLGKQILENKYEQIESIYGNGLYVIKEGDNLKLIDAKGETKLEEGYDKIAQILQYSSTKGIVFIDEEKYGVMNLDGDTLIPAEYEKIEEVKDSTFIAKKDGKYGVISIDGTNNTEFIYTGITYNKQADIFIADDEKFETSVLNNEFIAKLKGILSEVNTDKGYMKLKINGEYKYYNFKFEEKENKDILTSNSLFLSKKDGKYGFVNNKGEVVVDFQYDDATEQNSCGFAAVKKNGKWGSIDINGKVAVEPIYNLDNNFVIDFIGKWHLGQDINMNYYCEK